MVAGELPGRRRHHRAGRRTRATGEVVHAVHQDMFQVVLVPVDVGAHAVAVEQRLELADHLPAVVVLAGDGEQLVMADHDLPRGSRGRQRVLQPAQLRLPVLALDVHHQAAAVLLDERAGIDEEYFCQRAVRQHLRAAVVARRQAPAAGGAGVGKLRFHATLSDVVAEDDVPRRHQRRIGVDLLERGAPIGIGDAVHAVLVKIVADRNHEPATQRRNTRCDPSGRRPLADASGRAGPSRRSPRNRATAPAPRPARRRARRFPAPGHGG